MQIQEPHTSSFAYVVDYWKPDLTRFRTEVEVARKSGRGDYLTLAEMECSLDLIDADLAALRGAKAQDHRNLQSQHEAQRLRSELASLIEQMRPYSRN